MSQLPGDSARYDMVVEIRGRFLRVQVKSTTCQRFLGRLGGGSI